MSLDVDLMVTKPVSVYSNNITHNLGKMAKEVLVDVNLTLYDVLWRPEEHNLKFARDIVNYLDRGYRFLTAEPTRYRAFNPENGWGSYDGLCQFVIQYRNACMENPDAELSVSR